MTYARDPETVPGLLSAMVARLGADTAAEAAGVSTSRLRQLCNPMRRDWRVLETVYRLEAAHCRAGYGVPLSEFLRGRMIDDGAMTPGREEGRARLLEGCCRTVAAALRVVVEQIEAALEPVSYGPASYGPALAVVRA